MKYKVQFEVEINETATMFEIREYLKYSFRDVQNIGDNPLLKLGEAEPVDGTFKVVPTATPNKVAEEIINDVCGYAGIQPDILARKNRKRKVVAARQAAMYLIRKRTSMSLAEIGKMFGGKDHTTVIHACRTVEDLLMTKDPYMAGLINAAA